ncbi:MAG TPA: universal stress protein, partial [Gaiellaceae bacterium]
MFHNILVAVDGSQHADQALADAIDLAEGEHARITLLTAVVPPPVAGLFGATGDSVAAIYQEAQARAEAILRRARDRVPGDLPVSTVLSTEPIEPAL